MNFGINLLLGVATAPTTSDVVQAWMTIVFAAVGVLALGVGLILFNGTIKDIHKVRLIAGTPTSTIRAAALGLVELHGRVTPLESLVAPISKQPCAAWRYSLWIGPKGKQSVWTVSSEKTNVHPFYLEDDTGRVLVDPRDGNSFLSYDGQHQEEHTEPVELPYEFVAWAKHNHINYGAEIKQPWSVNVQWITIGTPAYVLGTLCAVEDKFSGLAKSEDRVVRRDPKDKIFLLSRCSPREMELGSHQFSRNGIVISALIAIGGLGMILIVSKIAALFFLALFALFVIPTMRRL